jgi:hypothetical protein
MESHTNKQLSEPYVEYCVLYSAFHNTVEGKGSNPPEWTKQNIFLQVLFIIFNTAFASC